MNPKLKDPVNIIGVLLTGIGGVMMFMLIVKPMTPEWIPITGFILWAVGIAVLAIHSRNDRN